MSTEALPLRPARGIPVALAVVLAVLGRDPGLGGLKAALGSAARALDTPLYGLPLILFIIYMPTGIPGTILERRRRRRWRHAPRCGAGNGLDRPDMASYQPDLRA